MTPCPPVAGLGSGSCSSHGQCVNHTDGRQLCLCGTYWTGYTDMFDLHVADDAQGRPLFLDCPMPWPLFTAVYALLFAAVLWRQWTMVRALVYKWKTVPATDIKEVGWLRAFFRYLPTRTMTLECLIGNPVLAAFPIIKFATGNSAVYGTDPGVTFTMSFGIFFQFIFFGQFTLEQFSILARSRSMNQDTGELLLRRFRRVLFIEGFIYLMAVVVFPFVATSLNRSVGPIANKEYVLLILRNVCIPLMFGLRFFSFTFMIGEVTGLLGPVKRVKDDNSNEKVAKSSEAASRVLGFLHRQQNTARGTAIVALLAYTLAAIPYFWDAQAVVICLITSLGMYSNNSGLVLLGTNKASVKKSDLGTGRGSIGTPVVVEGAVNGTGGSGEGALVPSAPTSSAAHSRRESA